MEYTLQAAWPVVSRETFGEAFEAARAVEIIGENTSPFDADRDETDTIFVLSPDRASGYAVRSTGELVYVFSTVKGRGAFIVAAALADGATNLDCFDGYLPTLYGRHGFREVRREANWTPGGPDVVYMAVA